MPSCATLVNGASSALIELAASPACLRMANGYAINVGGTGVRIGDATTTAGRFALDFGETANDTKILLYGGSGAGSGIYALGANNSALELHSPGTQPKTNQPAILLSSCCSARYQRRFAWSSAQSSDFTFLASLAQLSHSFSDSTGVVLNEKPRTSARP